MSSFVGIEISERLGSQFVLIKQIVNILKVIYSRKVIYSVLCRETVLIKYQQYFQIYYLKELAQYA